MGRAFEMICREHASRHIQAILSAPAQQIGQVWATDYDIDVVGRLLGGSTLYGECKWWRSEVGEGVLDPLIARSDKTSYGRDLHQKYFVVYARSGFTSALQIRAEKDENLALFTPDLMLVSG